MGAASPPSGGGALNRIGVTDVVSFVLLAVAVAGLWWQPTRVFACAPQSGGLARCEVSARLLGLVPLGHRTIAGIAHAGYGTQTAISELRDATTNRPHQLETRIERLLLADAEGRELWSSVESHLLGASLPDVASGIESLMGDEAAAPFLAWYVPWPVLLLCTLFLLIASSHLGTQASLALRRRGLLVGVSYGVAYWLPTLLVAGVLAVAWLVALAGANPPRWLSAIG
ncbi:MAG TPA: hypothetical protein VFS60_13310 [Thermoanaerobaculia bacterium]|nr:hypothetical protein [Thermoanaerobaculia bacterium]